MPTEVPELELPRLPQWQPSHDEMQIWWQQVVEASERHAAAINEVIGELITAQGELAATVALLNTTVDTLNDTVDTLGAALVRLGEVEVLADGTFVIVDQGLNADGTVKDNKVLTASIAPSNVTRVDPVLQVGTTALIADATEYTLLTNTVDTIPSGATGLIVMASAYFDDPTDNTLKARFRLYKNGVEQAIDFKRNDGTSTLFETDLAPVAGDVWHTTYVREGEDFYVSRGQLALMYFDR